jgi:hypothetical protein
MGEFSNSVLIFHESFDLLVNVLNFVTRRYEHRVGLAVTGWSVVNFALKFSHNGKIVTSPANRPGKI